LAGTRDLLGPAVIDGFIAVIVPVDFPYQMREIARYLLKISPELNILEQILCTPCRSLDLKFGFLPTYSCLILIAPVNLPYQTREIAGSLVELDVELNILEQILCTPCRSLDLKFGFYLLVLVLC